MGDVFYMAREDERGLQLYEMGKVAFWSELLGSGRPIIVRGDDRDLAMRLAARWRDGFTEPSEDACFDLLVSDLARWSEGKPVCWIMEQSGTVEHWQDARPPDECTSFPPVTGDRYRVADEEGARKTMEALA